MWRLSLKGCAGWRVSINPWWISRLPAHVTKLMVEKEAEKRIRGKLGGVKATENVGEVVAIMGVSGSVARGVITTMVVEDNEVLARGRHMRV